MKYINRHVKKNFEIVYSISSKHYGGTSKIPIHKQTNKQTKYDIRTIFSIEKSLDT